MPPMTRKKGSYTACSLFHLGSHMHRLLLKDIVQTIVWCLVIDLIHTWSTPHVLESFLIIFSKLPMQITLLSLSPYEVNAECHSLQLLIVCISIMSLLLFSSFPHISYYLTSCHYCWWPLESFQFVYIFLTVLCRHNILDLGPQH